MHLFRRGESSRTNDNTNGQDNRSNDTGHVNIMRRLLTSHNRIMPLANVEQAIAQGLSHDISAYNSTKDRYKTLRDNVLKVIEEFCEQRGQELLVNLGIARETHRIPNTACFVEIASNFMPDIVNREWQGDMTLNQMIYNLRNLIDEIKTSRNDTYSDNPYDSLTRQIQYFESVTRPFLTEMGNIYERRYGTRLNPPQYIEPPPQYQDPPGEHQAPGPT